jgi:hypothetical protein
MASTGQESEDYRKLQSEIAKEHGGRIPKGSEAAKAQSEADSKAADEGKDFPTIAARGTVQSAGDKPIEAIDPALGNPPLPEDVMEQERKVAEEKKKKTMEEFEKTPHFANTEI